MTIVSVFNAVNNATYSSVICSAQCLPTHANVSPIVTTRRDGPGRTICLQPSHRLEIVGIIGAQLRVSLNPSMLCFHGARGASEGPQFGPLYAENRQPIGRLDG